MSTEMSEKELYEMAKKRVEEKKGFYIHFGVYVVINLFLVALWLFTGAGFPWFIFPLLGWGIGILFHFLGIFVFSQRSNWERSEIAKEMERLRKDRSGNS